MGEGVVPFWTDSTLYFDMYAGYEFAEDMSIYTSVSNLTEEKEDIYAQWSDHVITQNISIIARATNLAHFCPGD